MRFMWASLGLAAAALAGQASAQELSFGPRSYPTVSEADAHRPPMPADCLGANGVALCVPMFIAEDGWDDDGEPLLVWRPAWGPPEQSHCVDEETAFQALSCDAPGAVRAAAPPPAPSIQIAPPPKIQVRPPTPVIVAPQ